MFIPFSWFRFLSNIKKKRNQNNKIKTELNKKEKKERKIEIDISFLIFNRKDINRKTEQKLKQK